MSNTLNKTYTLEDPKPKFKQGDIVEVDLGFFGWKNEIWQGKIVGIVSEYIFDTWIVDFGSDISETYPYTAVAVPHVSIIKNI
jgi:hypothetical protein